jgi:branched-chain amino acid transport system ATP-binding protein
MIDNTLVVEAVRAGYGQQNVLNDVSLRCAPGEVIAVIGPNGAGKSTFLKTICGIVKPSRGAVRWQAQNIAGTSPHRIVAKGIGHVQEGRALFWNLTVAENLRLGGHIVYRRNRKQYEATLGEMYEAFPALAERRQQRAGTLSGGEQQMLAIARVLMRSPTLLMLDEPSLGLAPIVIERIYEIIAGLKSSGMALIVVEPQPQQVLDVADRVVVFDRGRVLDDVPKSEFADHVGDLLATYLSGQRRARANGQAARPPAPVRPAEDAAPVHVEGSP